MGTDSYRFLHGAIRVGISLMAFGAACGFAPSRPNLSTSAFHRQRWSLANGPQLLPANAFYEMKTPILPSSSKLQAKAAKTVIAKNRKGEYILRGKLKSALDKIFLSPAELMAIFKTIGMQVVHDWKEILVIILLVNAPLPTARFISKFRQHVDEGKEWDKEKFLASKTRKIATVLSELGMLSGFMYAIDTIVLILKKFRFTFVDEYPIAPYAGTVIAAIWAARHLSGLKKYLIRRFVLGGNEFAKVNWEDIVSANVSGEILSVTNDDGKKVKMNPSRQSAARVTNRIGDGIITVSMMLIVLDILDIQIGFLIKSIFGLSSVASLAFSLASRNLVAEFLASLAIKGTNMFRVGEKIWLTDGTLGTVTQLGWLNTHIRRPDELVVRIPNTHLSGARLANISRVTMAQVRQTLAIKYQNIDKLNKLGTTIKECIRSNPGCTGKIVDDGTRPFRVNWREYKDKHLELVVDVHFRVRPNSDAYYSLQEKVLESIAEACDKLDVQFSYVEAKKEKNDEPSKVSFE